MALITCPECGQQISDQAPRCIKCGAPINGENALQNENISEKALPPKRKKKILIILLCLIIVITLAVIVFFVAKSNKAKRIIGTWSTNIDYAQLFLANDTSVDDSIKKDIKINPTKVYVHFDGNDATIICKKKDIKNSMNEFIEIYAPILGKIATENFKSDFKNDVEKNRIELAYQSYYGMTIQEYYTQSAKEILKDDLSDNLKDFKRTCQYKIKGNQIELSAAGSPLGVLSFRISDDGNSLFISSWENLSAYSNYIKVNENNEIVLNKDSTNEILSYIQ